MVDVRPGAEKPVRMLHDFVKYWKHKIVKF
jgi:hypothetical protein